MKPKIIIKLSAAHKKSGLTAYEVAKRLDLNEGTVRKYTSNDVTASFLPNHVLQLIKFYGLDWHDPEVIEIIDSAEDKSSGQFKTLLAELA